MSPLYIALFRMIVPTLGLLAAFAPGALAYSARDMLSAPRPHAPVPHPNHMSALAIVDTWDPEHDRTSRVVNLIDLPLGITKTLIISTPAEVAEVFWLDKEWAYLNGSAITQGKDGHVVHRFPEGVGANDLEYADGKVFFVGQIWEGQDFDEVDKVDKKYNRRGDTGVVFDELFVRYVEEMAKLM